MAGASLSSLRAVPASKVVDLNVLNAPQFILPILDGHTVTLDMWEAFRSGQVAPVPFMIGATSQESPTNDTSGPFIDSFIKQEHVPALKAAYGGEVEYAKHLSGDLAFTAGR